VCNRSTELQCVLYCSQITSFQIWDNIYSRTRLMEPISLNSMCRISETVALNSDISFVELLAGSRDIWQIYEIWRKQIFVLTIRQLWNILMHHTIDDKANHLNVLEDWTYTLKSYQGFYALKAHQGCRILDKDDGHL